MTTLNLRDRTWQVDRRPEEDAYHLYYGDTHVTEVYLSDSSYSAEDFLSGNYRYLDTIIPSDRPDQFASPTGQPYVADEAGQEAIREFIAYHLGNPAPYTVIAYDDDQDTTGAFWYTCRSPHGTYLAFCDAQKRYRDVMTELDFLDPNQDAATFREHADAINEKLDGLPHPDFRFICVLRGHLDVPFATTDLTDEDKAYGEE